MSNEIKPFSMHRFVSLWCCECEFEVDGNVVFLWEPLHYPGEKLTEKDRPHWNDEYITFYRVEEKDWLRITRHLMFSRSASPDVLILQNGLCVEVTGGQVVWRSEFERWFIRWQGYTHSRMSLLASTGLEQWRNL
ncbi:MAG: hypothetical protein HY231_24210 [Acidobacteria bacterium]|nr:hypothetical protein [Acidobacteriota bacterium]